MSSNRGKSVSDFTGKTENSNDKKIARKRPLPVEAEYSRILVNGVVIWLPPGFSPYTSQKLMMVKMIQAFKNKRNAMIESPTGSGKTMGLLAAACAWLQEYKEKRRIAKQQCPKHGVGGIDLTAQFEKAASDIKIPRDDSMNTTTDTLKSDQSLFLNRSKVDDDHEIQVVYDAFGEVVDTTFDYDNAEHLPEPECTCSEMKRIRIYYGTRTHKQISQVVKEFGRLPYGHEKNEKQLRHTILASREQSCLNADVRRSDDLTSACKERIAPEGIGCVYRTNLRALDDPSKLRKKIEQNGGGVWDMEDLTEALKTPEICPYFASTRSMTIDADIIFTPFNYLLDPIIRASSDVILKNSIVILDEAHNVEDTCRDAVSFTFKESEFINALNNFNEKVSAIKDCSLLQYMKTPSPVTDGEKVGGDCASAIKNMADSLKRMAKLAKRMHTVFTDLAKQLGEQPSSANRDSKTWNWDALLDILKSDDSEKNLYFENQDPEFKQYSSDFAVIVNQKKEDNNETLEEILKEFRPSPVAIVLVEKYLYFMTYFSRENNKELYKGNVTMTRLPPEGNWSTQRHVMHKKPKGRKGAAILDEDGFTEGVKPSVQAIRPGFEASLNFWCMSPSIACNEAFKDSLSIVLASGTLCPTETLKTELGFQFELQMEGDQVIPDKQIFATIIAKGPNKYPFNCTYKNMQDQMFFIELLRTIRDICKTVPKGVLVFVSSYRILNQLQENMQHDNLRTDIEKHKTIFFEPNRSRDLKEILEDYTYIIQNSGNDLEGHNGALMIAVFRGKVSEGIDFTDDMARCVICVGIPFPNFTDELVIQKKRFNDLHCRTSKLLSGDQWYSTQAYRALNQALGRCLRHRNDWGAILLVDERFLANVSPNHPDSKKISRWVRHRLVRYNDHEALIHALGTFVEERMNHDLLMKQEVGESLNYQENKPVKQETGGSYNYQKPRRQGSIVNGNKAFKEDVEIEDVTPTSSGQKRYHPMFNNSRKSSVQSSSKSVFGV